MRVNRYRKRSTPCSVIAAMGVVIAVTIGASAPAVASSVMDTHYRKTMTDVRANEVKNSCRMYAKAFLNIYDVKPPMGQPEAVINRRSMYNSIVGPDDARQVKEFINVIAGELMDVRDRQSAEALLKDPRRFIQPCYNAVAQRYDERQASNPMESRFKPAQTNWGKAQPAPPREYQASTQGETSVRPTEVKNMAAHEALNNKSSRQSRNASSRPPTVNALESRR